MSGEDVMIPDVKAVNIVMNVYAKLGDWESAMGLLDQMRSERGGEDVPKMEPNIVTYNTLIDACHRAGELIPALSTFHTMTATPDARTYTSLISTVARKPSPHYGVNDPALAFDLLDNMIRRGVTPNGMTYCALIDVCSRCGRSDLALKGLRMMLRQEKEQRERGVRRRGGRDDYVGAWTAAIDACGKAGHVDTALKLFHAMEKFGSRPNTVTCGCLMDRLLRAPPLSRGTSSDGDAGSSHYGNDTEVRISDALDVLRYMRSRNMEPSEVMYTSLISSAGRLVKLENRMTLKERRQPDHDNGGNSGGGGGTTCAIDVYKELMGSLMLGDRKSSAATTPQTHTLLLKVFLVFQEMKSRGATPDVACYNALLRACANAGDIAKAHDTFAQMTRDGNDVEGTESVIPNDLTWRELLRAAARGGGEGDVEEVWNMARGWKEGVKVEWRPDGNAFEALVMGYWRDCGSLLEGVGAETEGERFRLYEKIVVAYCHVLAGEGDNGDFRHRFSDIESSIPAAVSGLEHVDLDDIHSNQKLMLIILRAAVVLELAKGGSGSRQHDQCNDKIIVSSSVSPMEEIQRYNVNYCEVARRIVRLECLSENSARVLTMTDSKTANALQLARIWSEK